MVRRYSVSLVLFLSGLGCDTQLGQLSKRDLAYLSCSQLGFNQSGNDELWGLFVQARDESVPFEKVVSVVVQACEHSCVGNPRCRDMCHGCLGLMAEAVYFPDGQSSTAVAVQKLRFPLAGRYNASRISGHDYNVQWRSKTCVDGITPLLHTGVDFDARAGDSVYAVADGVVKYAQIDVKWGGYVVLEHDGTTTTTYTHVIPYNIFEGDMMVKGRQIATISLGNANFNPHLHFQWREASFDINMTLRGRLPKSSCVVADSPYPQPEPAFFQGRFRDPKTLDWE